MLNRWRWFNKKGQKKCPRLPGRLFPDALGLSNRRGSLLRSAGRPAALQDGRVTSQGVTSGSWAGSALVGCPGWAPVPVPDLALASFRFSSFLWFPVLPPPSRLCPRSVRRASRRGEPFRRPPSGRRRAVGLEAVVLASALGRRPRCRAQQRAEGPPRPAPPPHAAWTPPRVILQLPQGCTPGSLSAQQSRSTPAPRFAFLC